MALVASTAPLVYALAAGAGLLGIALIVVGIRLVVATRADPEALAGLEELSSRHGRRAAAGKHAGEGDGAEPVADSSADTLPPPGNDAVAAPLTPPATDADADADDGEGEGEGGGADDADDEAGADAAADADDEAGADTAKDAGAAADAGATEDADKAADPVVAGGGADVAEMPAGDDPVVDVDVVEVAIAEVPAVDLANEVVVEAVEHDGVPDDVSDRGVDIAVDEVAVDDPPGASSDVVDVEVTEVAVEDRPADS